MTGSLVRPPEGVINREPQADIVKIVEEWQVSGAKRTDGAPEEMLSSGAFSRRSRLSPKALRLYDQLGLLKPDRVDPFTGYRGYRSSQLVSARLISALRRLDMPLATIAEIVAEPRSIAAARLEAYWQDFEAKVAVQRELAAHLRRRLAYGDAQSDLLCAVRTREMPRQVVLCEQRNVLQPDLAPYLEEAMPRGVQIAYRDLGGVSDALFVIYHGEVSYDSDGPVEVCVPIGPTNEGRADRPIRVEEAHAEAYLRVRKAQVAHPQILSAYDAVAAWIHGSGRAIAGPPREIYFHHDFAGAAVDEQVCDVAFPVVGEL